MTNANMITKESTIEYRIPPSEGEWNLMFVLLPKVAEIFGVQDMNTAHQRMRNRLIEWGWIKKSRKELDHFQVQDVIRRYDNFINPKRKEEGGRRTLSADKEHDSYAESGIRKTL